MEEMKRKPVSRNFRRPLTPYALTGVHPCTPPTASSSDGHGRSMLWNQRRRPGSRSSGPARRTEAFGIVWMIVDLNLCKNRNFCAHSRNFQNSLERDFDLNFLQVIDIQILYVVLTFRIFRVAEVWLKYR